jgi:hypothetical protein
VVKDMRCGQGPVVYACNPSYSGRERRIAGRSKQVKVESKGSIEGAEFNHSGAIPEDGNDCKCGGS